MEYISYYTFERELYELIMKDTKTEIGVLVMNFLKKHRPDLHEMVTGTSIDTNDHRNQTDSLMRWVARKW